MGQMKRNQICPVNNIITLYAWDMELFNGRIG